MRMFGLLSLALALLTAAILAKKQVGVGHTAPPAVSAASDEGTPPTVIQTPQQAQQITQQLKSDVDQLMQDRSGQLERELESAQP